MQFYYYDEDREPSEEVNDNYSDPETKPLVISLLYFDGVIDE
jgi:hypothetical protein